MKISSKAYYGLMAMWIIADRADQKANSVTLAEISDSLNISISYLEQLFARLRINGLVGSKRGPGGGYTLSRPASEISVAQVITAVNGRVYANTPINPDQQVDVLWNHLSKRLYGFLDNISLADARDKQAMLEVA